MKRSISFEINEDVYGKFQMAVDLSKESKEKAIETCMRWYISETFKKASLEYKPVTTTASVKEEGDFYGKAIDRIPQWALKPKQYNHKIIKSYFAAVDKYGSATIKGMQQLCSQKDNPELYVPTFRNNYSQMKIDGYKSHGKVFEDDGEKVWLWKEVKEIVEKYKTSFYDSES